jgi:hypothetical protein
MIFRFSLKVLSSEVGIGSDIDNVSEHKYGLFGFELCQNQKGTKAVVRCFIG